VAQKTSSKSSSLRRISAKATKKSASRATKSRASKIEIAGSESSMSEDEVSIDRRRNDRRDQASGQETSSAAAPQLERRKKVNRRRQIDPTTCERDYTEQEVEFMNALDDYKRKSGRMFPTCSEVLEVLRGLGYVKLSSAELNAMPLDCASTTSAKPMPSAWQDSDTLSENADDGASVASHQPFTL
jgi:hypothetical protein